MIGTLIVDAGPVIKTGESLALLAKCLIKVSEVIAELRDPGSKAAFEALHIPIRTPLDQTMKQVIQFAKKTDPEGLLLE
jgi:rRNA maturation endonuclease Nob1